MSILNDWYSLYQSELFVNSHGSPISEATRTTGSHLCGRRRITRTTPSLTRYIFPSSLHSLENFLESFFSLGMLVFVGMQLFSKLFEIVVGLVMLHHIFYTFYYSL